MNERIEPLAIDDEVSTSQYLIKPKQRLIMRLINFIGAGLKKIGINAVDLNEEKLIAAAKKKTGLEDFGDNDFLQGMRQFIQSVEQESDAHTFGRISVKGLLDHALENRLNIQAYCQQNPQAQEQTITRPLFILGLPRTGTTLLFNLLAQDKTNRWIVNWEAATPAPSAKQKKANERQKFSEDLCKQQNYFLSDLKYKHENKPYDPQECNVLFINSFESEILWYCNNIPAYREWLNQRDRVASYEYFRDQLKVLQHQHAESRWLLKSPTHIFAIDALLKVFPDANIIQTHRDPTQVLASTCSLKETILGISSPVIDRASLGQETLEQFSNGIKHCMTVREKYDAKQFYDVYYKKLVTNPLQVIESIYQQFDIEMTSETKDRMQQYLIEQPQHKHGVHRYSLEQYGLNEKSVNEAFSDYVKYYDI